MRDATQQSTRAGEQTRAHKTIQSHFWADEQTGTLTRNHTFESANEHTRAQTHNHSTAHAHTEPPTKYPNTQTHTHTHTHTRTPTHTHTDEHASDQACTQTSTHPPINGMIFHGVRTSPSRRTRRAGRRAVAILHGARNGLTIDSTTNGIECMLIACVC